MCQAGSVSSIGSTTVSKMKMVPAHMKFRDLWGKEATTKSTNRYNFNMISAKMKNKLGK